jgi:hypothetical protein
MYLYNIVLDYCVIQNVTKFFLFFLLLQEIFCSDETKLILSLNEAASLTVSNRECVISSVNAETLSNTI